MSDTTYTDYALPPISAAWLNDVNVAVYRGLANSTGVIPSTLGAMQNALGLGVTPDASGAKGNATWNGATGTSGSGNDDTAALQAWASALTGKVGVGRPGAVYRISGVITFPAGTRTYGNGAVILVDSPLADIRAFMMTTGADDVEHYGWIFATTPNDIANRGHQYMAWLNGANRGRALFNRFYHPPQYGIIVGDTGTNGGAAGHDFSFNYMDLSLQSNVAVAPCGIEIFPKGGANFLADSLRIIGNRIVCGTGVVNSPIKVNSYRNAIIEENVLESGLSTNLSAVTGAIDLASSSDCIITGNTMDGFRFGIVIGNAAGIDNGIVNNGITVGPNTIRNPQAGSQPAYGVWATDGMDRLTVLAQQIDASTGTFGSFIGINVAPVLAAHTNLYIEGPTQIGGNIAVYSPFTASGSLQNIGAQILNVTGVSQSQSAIYAQADDITVADCTVRLNAGIGIWIAGTACKLRECDVIDANTGNVSQTPGILYGGVSGLTTTDGDISGCAVRNQTASGHSSYGLEVQNAGSPKLRDNTFTCPSGDIFWVGTITSGLPRAQGTTEFNSRVSLTGTTTLTNLQSFLNPGGSLGLFGGFDITLSGTLTGTAGTKLINLLLSTTVLTFTIPAATTGNWMADIKVRQRGVQNSQVIKADVSAGGALLAGSPFLATSATDCSANITVFVQGQLGNSGDTLTLDLASFLKVAG